MKSAISTEHAPQAIGPYSQAIRSGNLIFASGQVGTDPVTGQYVSDEIAGQSRQAFRNLQAVLSASGSGLDQALKVSVYLTDMALFQQMNQVYKEFFAEPYPARVTVAVAGMAAGALVEVDCIAQVQ